MLDFFNTKKLAARQTEIEKLTEQNTELSGQLDEARREAEKLRAAAHAEENPAMQAQPPADAAQSTAQTRQALCAEANELEGRLSDRLSASRRELCSLMSAWQSDLYRGEYMPLAQAYLNLCMMIGGLQSRVDSIPAPPAGTEPSPERLLLEKHLRSLGAFRTSLERALSGVGLTVFAPKPGEAFDPYFHSPLEGSAETAAGKSISRCVWPGVKQSAEDSGEEAAVLIPAAVEVES